MKYIKTYEELNIGEPEVGDYVFIDVDWIDNNPLKHITDNNIGIIFNIIPTGIYECNYPNDDRTFRVSRGQIKYWSKNKEDLETIIQSKKYNL